MTTPPRISAVARNGTLAPIGGLGRIGGFALLLLAGCGGGGHHHGAPIQTFACSGVAALLPNQVSLECPGTASGMIPVRVVLGGQSTSSDIYGFKFDLVFDPAVLAFVPPALEGPFLNQGGAPTILQAGTKPGEPGRMIVAITRQGAVGGVQASFPMVLVMTLSFGATGTGSTTLAFENGEAVDPSMPPAAIPSIQFVAQPLTISFQ